MKYELSDFFTKTRNETSSKMELLLDNKKTGHYLMVKGIESRDVQDARIKAQIAYSEIEEKTKDMPDKLARAIAKKDLEEFAQIELALVLVDGWSFGDFDLNQLKELLEENSGLALSVIGFSSTTKNYLQKK